MYNSTELLKRRHEERQRFRETVERRLKAQQSSTKPKSKKEIEDDLLRQRKESGYNGGTN